MRSDSLMYRLRAPIALALLVMFIAATVMSL